jgi:hypothetical protein
MYGMNSPHVACGLRVDSGESLQAISSLGSRGYVMLQILDQVSQKQDESLCFGTVCIMLISRSVEEHVTHAEQLMHDLTPRHFEHDQRCFLHLFDEPYGDRHNVACRSLAVK